MASDLFVYLDLTKFEHELERMKKGEIPMDLAYLEELVEVRDQNGRSLVAEWVEIELFDDDEEDD